MTYYLEPFYLKKVNLCLSQASQIRSEVFCFCNILQTEFYLSPQQPHLKEMV